MTTDLSIPALRLDDRPLARVVDDLLDDDDRRAGSLLVLVASPDRRTAVPMVVDDVPPAAGRDELARFVTTLADIACHAMPHGGLALGVGLPGRPGPGDCDWWDEVVREACRQAGLTFLGVCLAPAGPDAQVAATGG